MTEITKKDVRSLRMRICDELEKENKDNNAMIALLEYSNDYLKELEYFLTKKERIMGEIQESIESKS